MPAAPTARTVELVLGMPADRECGPDQNRAPNDKGDFNPLTHRGLFDSARNTSATGFETLFQVRHDARRKLLRGAVWDTLFLQGNGTSKANQ